MLGKLCYGAVDGEFSVNQKHVLNKVSLNKNIYKTKSGITRSLGNYMISFTRGI